MSSGKAIIFSAPSGAGKTTIVQHLIHVIPTLKFSISATTRPIRASVEKNGRDYHFLTMSEFKERLKRNEFLEWEEVYKGTFYGTLRSEVQHIWDSGGHVIFDVDVKGGIKLKQELGEHALAVFVGVENLDTLANRLRKRNTDPEDKLRERIEKASSEMQFANQFDLVLINHDLQKACSEAELLVNNFIG